MFERFLSDPLVRSELLLTQAKNRLYGKLLSEDRFFLRPKSKSKLLSPETAQSKFQNT